MTTSQQHGDELMLLRARYDALAAEAVRQAILSGGSLKIDVEGITEP